VSQDINLQWKDDDTPYLSYIIEACVGENTHEPYAIRNFSIDGDLTPVGGSAIVSCRVDDWQNDVSKVIIFTGEFYGRNLKMVRVGDTNMYLCNLVNGAESPDRAQPGQHSVWVQAESPDSYSAILKIPMYFNIPDTTDSASEPFTVPESDPYKYAKQSDFYEYAVPTRLYFSFLNREEKVDPLLDFQWEQVYPLEPEGELRLEYSGTNQVMYWYPAEVATDTTFIFRVSAKNRENHLTSKAILAVPVELPRPPEIVSGPTLNRQVIFEKEQCNFTVDVIDPNFPNDRDSYFTCWWDQMSPSEPQGAWVNTSHNYRTSNPGKWIAPQVDMDTPFTIRISVSKNWLDPPLTTSASIDFIVKNREEE
jgi:hypothetical protein